MAGNAEIVSGQPALDPGKLPEEGLDHVHEDWRHAVHMYQPCEGLCISCINGRPGSKWAFQAEGPSAFSVNILLEGRMQAAFDDGAALDAKAGSAIMMATGSYAKGWDVLDGQSEGAFRMVNIHMPQTAMAGLTGLQMAINRTSTPSSVSCRPPAACSVSRATCWALAALIPVPASHATCTCVPRRSRPSPASCVKTLQRNRLYCRCLLTDPT